MRCSLLDNMVFQFRMVALLGGQRHRRESWRVGDGEEEGATEKKKKRERPGERRWYGTFVSNPIPHTIWLHYHYAGEKTSVSLKIKAYLAPSKLTPNETCLSPCDSVSVIALLLNSLRSAQMERAAVCGFAMHVRARWCTWPSVSGCAWDRDRAVSQWLIITEESP